MIEPDDVTHIDDDGGRYSYLGENKYSVWMDNEKIPYWREMPHNNIECASSIRSVSDVKRISELEHYNVGLADESCQQQRRIAELEKELEFFYEEAMNSLAPPKEQG